MTRGLLRNNAPTPPPSAVTALGARVTRNVRCTLRLPLLLLTLWSASGCAAGIEGAHAPIIPATPVTHDLSGSWTLRIENLEHRPAAALTVQFSEERAISCIGGDWHRLLVTAKALSDQGFFPASDPLSYQVSGDELTIGRNEMCDAYLHLHGQLSGNAARGEYIAFGLDRAERLGYFILERTP